MTKRVVVPEFYLQPGLMTDFRGQSEHVAALPTNLGSLCGVLQGLLLHVFWLEAHGYAREPRQIRDRNIRDVETTVRLLIERDSSQLDVPRKNPDRVVTDCRGYSVMLTALLIYAGIPARSRCGFAKYFWPPDENRWEDHWVTEYWNKDSEEWRLADGQLDETQQRHLRIGFDPLDVPRDQFLPATRAWKLCRCGEMDSSALNYENFSGLALVRWNLIRDVAALNKVEALGWDHWGGMFPLDDMTIPEEDVSLYDRVSTLASENEGLEELSDLYLRDLRLRVPRVVHLMEAETEAHRLSYSDILDGRNERISLL